MTEVHHCHARGCTTPVEPRLFMCKRHWVLLPGRMRDRVRFNYRPGQEKDKSPSARWLAAAREAIAYVERFEAAGTIHALALELERATPLEFVPAKGRLGIFPVSFNALPESYRAKHAELSSTF